MGKKKIRMTAMAIVLFALVVLVGYTQPAMGTVNATSGAVAGTTNQQTLEQEYPSTEVSAYTSLSQFSGKNIGILTGGIVDRVAAKAIPGIKILYYNSMADEIAALIGGKVEAVVFDEPIARLAQAKYPEVVVFPQKVADDQYGLALAKGSPLTQQVNAAIAQLKEEGVLNALKEKWIGTDASVKTPVQLENKGENGTLRVVCDIMGEPMTYLSANKEIIGYDIDLMHYIGQKLGMKVRFTTVSFAAIIPMLQGGKADIATGCISITEERRQGVDLSDPYYDSGLFLLVRKGNGGAQISINSFFQNLSESFTRTFLTENRWKLVVDGLGVTVLLSVCSGILGLAFGFGLCMLRRSKKRIVSMPAAILIRIVQGTPIVVLLMIFYYVVFGGIDISAIVVAILGFSLNFAAYASEMMRAGIAGVDNGQVEAARALGFSRVKSFCKVVFPQAACQFLPVLKGEFVSLVKMTAVVGYISIQDLTKISDIIRSRTLEAFFPLIATAIIYFLVANVLLFVISKIEINFDPKRKKPRINGVARE